MPLNVNCNPSQFPVGQTPKVCDVTVSGGRPAYSLQDLAAPPGVTVQIQVVDANAGTFRVTITGTVEGHVELHAIDQLDEEGVGIVQLTP